MQIQLSEHFSYMNTPWFQGVWISGLATVHAIVHMLLEHTSYNLTVYVLLLPTNFKTYLKQPLEDQQTVLYFCRDDHLYPVAERSDFFCWLQCYSAARTQWTGIFGMRKLFRSLLVPRLLRTAWERG